MDETDCKKGVRLQDNLDGSAFKAENICDTCDVLLTMRRARSDSLCSAQRDATLSRHALKKNSRRSKPGGGVGRVTSDASLLRLSAAARGLASTMRASVDEWSDTAMRHEALRAKRAVKSRSPDMRPPEMRTTRGGSARPTVTWKNSAAFRPPWQHFDRAIKDALNSVSSSGGQVSVEVEKRRILELRMLHEEGLITKDEMTRGIDAVISSITTGINDAE